MSLHHPHKCRVHLAEAVDRDDLETGWLGGLLQGY
jgi:hypothetical protein